MEASPKKSKDVDEDEEKEMEVLGFSQKELRKRNEEIEKQLKSEKKKSEKTVKLLLLGAGESGKSTIAKQMKILHLKGFSDAEKIAFKSIIFENIVTSIQTLIKASRDLKIQLESDNEEVADRLVKITAKTLDAKSANDVQVLWSDSGIKKTYERRSEYQLMDSAPYFLDSAEKFTTEGYIPDEQDILRSRVQTSGVSEIEFTLDGTIFKLVDVGGQRGERKKWILCFSDVTAILFCVALSEYDLKLAEDNETNRMQESLKVFSAVSNDKWLQKVGIILFLNKKDLFEEKIQKVDLKVCFPEYKDGKDYEKAVAFIQNKFITQSKFSQTKIYPHITTATDTGNIAKVWNVTKDIVLRTALQHMGMMDGL